MRLLQRKSLVLFRQYSLIHYMVLPSFSIKGLTPIFPLIIILQKNRKKTYYILHTVLPFGILTSQKRSWHSRYPEAQLYCCENRMYELLITIFILMVFIQLCSTFFIIRQKEAIPALLTLDLTEIILTIVIALTNTSQTHQRFGYFLFSYF